MRMGGEPVARSTDEHYWAMGLPARGVSAVRSPGAQKSGMPPAQTDRGTPSLFGHNRKHMFLISKGERCR